MLKFNEEQITKYKNSSIGGTGFLAFRDIELFAKRNNADLSYCHFQKTFSIANQSCREIQFH